MFSRSDITKLQSAPTADDRQELAARLADVDAQRLTGAELREAQGIMTALAKDVEVKVRAALAKALRQSRHLPYVVARTLASDVDTVALPILTESLLLTDSDLIDIARRGSPAAQSAVAARPELAEPVCEALVVSAHEGAVATLMRNPTSRISEAIFGMALDRFPESDAVKEGMARRPILPPAVAERLVMLVSDELQHYLLTTHQLPPTLVSELARRSRECAILRVSRDLDPAELGALAAQLKLRGRLTPTLLLRALCRGERAFFEASIALLADIPIDNARRLVSDPGTSAFDALYEKTGLPIQLRPAFRAALDVLGMEGADPPAYIDDRFGTRVIARFRALVRGQPTADVRYALDRLQEVTSEG